MIDRLGRNITYVRVSVTDRCNLRCRYCMPETGVPFLPHEEILRFEEITEVVRTLAKLGLRQVKLTGGEPLCRHDLPVLARMLGEIPGIEEVTLTTNGLLLPPLLDELCAAGLDGVNISLDTLDNAQYQCLTRRAHTADEVLHAVRLCAARLPTKINAVLLPETVDQLIPLAELAQTWPVDVRFIERMPLGTAQTGQTTSADAALDRLRARWPQLQPVAEPRGNGPARYFRAPGMQGCLGLIDAVSHGFCDRCNRLRLTSTGLLKPCLCYEQGVELRPLLRGGADETALQNAIRKAILQKPAAHCFAQRENITEHKSMNQIGG